MSDETEPIAPSEETIKPLSHARILKLMGILGLACGLLGGVFISFSFGLGVIVGCLLAFFNYFWLKASLRKIFDQAAATGDRPRFLALRYIARYLVLAVIVAVLYAAEAVSVVGLILGMGSFGFAVVFEGLFNIFSGPGRSRAS